jgi:DNA polymerase III epsilon subunit-like protein
MASWKRRLDRLAAKLGVDAQQERHAIAQHRTLMRTIALCMLAHMRKEGQHEATAEDIAWAEGDWDRAEQLAAKRKAREPKPPPEVENDPAAWVRWIASSAIRRCP